MCGFCVKPTVAEFCDVTSELTYSTVRVRNIESMVGKTAVHAEKKTAEHDQFVWSPVSHRKYICISKLVLMTFWFTEHRIRLRCLRSPQFYNQETTE